LGGAAFSASIGQKNELSLEKNVKLYGWRPFLICFFTSFPLLPHQYLLSVIFTVFFDR
jgi:hypothetical protein